MLGKSECKPMPYPCHCARGTRWVPLPRPVSVRIALALLLTFCLASCRKGKEAPGTQAFEIEKKFERGPVTFFVKVNKKEITIADRITLVLEVQAAEDYEVKFPQFGEKLHEFGIVDYHTPPQKLIEGGKVQRQKVFTLDPFLSGEYEIPPMKVTFWKKGEEGKKHEVESEEITIKVKSILPEKMAKLKIKDIAGPAAIPAPPRGWLYAAIAGGIAMLAAIVGFVIWRRRRASEAGRVPALPPHEVAFLLLEKLLSEGLIEAGETKLFYQRLTDILRHYIENRFGLHAPERTTEEFLSDLRNRDTLENDHKKLLREFLSHCDLVKFAEHRPANEEIQKAFDACKRFIVETKSEIVTAKAAAA
ncbi:MAG: protein BatD [Planctomycetes bacterium]|nr:protein BatD [Planctomycetota bacterium]